MSNEGSVISMSSVPVPSIENANRLGIFDWKAPKETDEANLVVNLEILISTSSTEVSDDFLPLARALKTYLVR